jgi:hypothetical protein
MGDIDHSAGYASLDTSRQAILEGKGKKATADDGLMVKWPLCISVWGVKETIHTTHSMLDEMRKFSSECLRYS